MEDAPEPMQTSAKTDPDLPVLWSFRRCPYAIRARLALLSARQPVALREILLRDKPPAFLRASPSATVPALEVAGQVIDESLEIMRWALERHDPEGLLEMPDAGWALITQNDGPFKAALDHTKYAARYPDRDARADRERAAEILRALENRLSQAPYLFGAKPKLAALALVPFIRQFAYIDRAWFDAQPWPGVIRWLDAALASPAFERAMAKAPVWSPEASPLVFGSP